MRPFDPLGFTPTYACDVAPEFPGDGDWRVPTYSFFRDGRPSEALFAAYGTQQVARVHLGDGTTWVGSGESSGLGMISGAFGCPAPDELCLVFLGQAYVVDTRDPTRYRMLRNDTQTVKHLPGLDLLLLVGDTDLSAVGPGGRAWRSARICLDELQVLSASQAGIVCSGRDSAVAYVRYVLSPEDGRLLSGPACPYGVLGAVGAEQGARSGELNLSRK